MNDEDRNSYPSPTAKKNRQLNRHSSINGKARKTQRREQSIARKAEYDKLSLQEKLRRLPAGGAMRQRARLERLIAAQKQSNEERTAKKRERTQKAAQDRVDANRKDAKTETADAT